VNPVKRKLPGEETASLLRQYEALHRTAVDLPFRHLVAAGNLLKSWRRACSLGIGLLFDA
jgi:hypothetical protein